MTVLGRLHHRHGVMAVAVQEGHYATLAAGAGAAAAATADATAAGTGRTAGPPSALSSRSKAVRLEVPFQGQGMLWPCKSEEQGQWRQRSGREGVRAPNGRDE